MKSCPFCGKAVDLTDEDTLYPSGIYWQVFDEESGMRSYHSNLDCVSMDGECFTMHCPIPSGGCGAEISADSEEEAKAAWNRRV